MWALVLVLYMSYAGSPVILPERYNSEEACKIVGQRAVDERRMREFRCINISATR